MSAFLYPLFVLRFWYLEAPAGILRFYRYLNLYVASALSIRLLLKTFFRPLKNEYRMGLVWFSVMMGVGFKSVLIVTSVIMLIIILAFEIIFLFAFLLFPFIPFYLLFV